MKIFGKVLEKLIKLILQMETPEWKFVSSNAKDLVLQMLSPNPINRPTVAEILEHPWMRVSFLSQIIFPLVRKTKGFPLQFPT